MESAWLVSYVSVFYSRIRAASSSLGFGRVPQGFMGTEYKAYDWHLLPWMGYQLSLFFIVTVLVIAPLLLFMADP